MPIEVTLPNAPHNRAPLTEPLERQGTDSSRPVLPLRAICGGALKKAARRKMSPKEVVNMSLATSCVKRIVRAPHDMHLLRGFRSSELPSRPDAARTCRVRVFWHMWSANIASLCRFTVQSEIYARDQGRSCIVPPGPIGWAVSTALLLPLGQPYRQSWLRGRTSPSFA